MASSAKPKRKKAGWTAADWPAEGRVTARGWCAVCRSYWCPHANPGLYAKRDVSRFYNGRGPRMTPDPYALKGNPNEIVMSGTYEEGVDRGDAAEAYVHRMLPGSTLMPRHAPYDIRTASGVRIDVKATRRGNDLMIPNQQRAKVDPARVDVLMLVYENPHEIVGWVTPAEFMERKQNGDHMVFPCRFVAVSDLNAIVPTDWMAHA